MKKNTTDVSVEDQPLESLLLHFKENRYKIASLALRWAREVKQKESLPDSIPTLVPRALRDILTGRVALKEIEKLPFLIKAPVAAAPAPAAPAHPTITLAPSKEESEQ